MDYAPGLEEEVGEAAERDFTRLTERRLTVTKTLEILTRLERNGDWKAFKNFYLQNELEKTENALEDAFEPIVIGRIQGSRRTLKSVLNLPRLINLFRNELSQIDTRIKSHDSRKQKGTQAGSGDEA